jgi:hypothetical protein
MPIVQGPPAPWRKVRALVITYFVLFNVLAALPTVGTASAERLERPFERAELRRWAELLQAMGIDMSPSELARAYLSFASAVERGHAAILVPIEWWMSLTQTAQSWRLFGTPDQQANVLRITAHSAGGEEVLYESANPARRWNAALLEYRRIRAAYNPSRSGPPPTYAGLSERLGEQIFESMPHVERVTVSLIQSRIPLPGEHADPTREETHVVELSRRAR